MEQCMGTFITEVASSLAVKDTTVFGTSLTFHLSVLNCTFVQVRVCSPTDCDCVIFQNLWNNNMGSKQKKLNGLNMEKIQEVLDLIHKGHKAISTTKPTIDCGTM
jgi:hypothetical protein